MTDPTVARLRELAQWAHSLEKELRDEFRKYCRNDPSRANTANSFADGIRAVLRKLDPLVREISESPQPQEQKPPARWKNAALLKDRTRSAIRDRFKAGETAESLAEDFYVPASFVTAICSWQLFEGTDVEDARSLPVSRQLSVESRSPDGDGPAALSSAFETDGSHGPSPVASRRSDARSATEARIGAGSEPADSHTTLPVSRPATIEEELRRQGCSCQCCDHGEGSDCGCYCHSEGLCAFYRKPVSRPAETLDLDRLRNRLARHEHLLHSESAALVAEIDRLRALASRPASQETTP